MSDEQDPAPAPAGRPLSDVNFDLGVGTSEAYARLKETMGEVVRQAMPHAGFSIPESQLQAIGGSAMPHLSYDLEDLDLTRPEPELLRELIGVQQLQAETLAALQRQQSAADAEAAAVAGAAARRERVMLWLTALGLLASFVAAIAAVLVLAG
jgi:hypothetical protein